MRLWFSVCFLLLGLFCSEVQAKKGFDIGVIGEAGWSVQDEDGSWENQFVLNKLDQFTFQLISVELRFFLSENFSLNLYIPVFGQLLANLAFNFFSFPGISLESGLFSYFYFGNGRFRFLIAPGLIPHFSSGYLHRPVGLGLRIAFRFGLEWSADRRGDSFALMLETYANYTSGYHLDAGLPSRVITGTGGGVKLIFAYWSR